MYGARLGLDLTQPIYRQSNAGGLLLIRLIYKLRESD